MLIIELVDILSCIFLIWSIGCSDGEGKNGATSEKDIPLNCTTEKCRTFVVDRIILPTTTEDTAKYALEINSQKYNFMGVMLNMLFKDNINLDLQSALDGTINSGKYLIMLRIQDSDLKDNPVLKGQLLLAAEKKRCSDPKNNTKCIAEAKTNCFGGSAEFSLSQGGRLSQLYKGSISDGTFKLGPGKGNVALAFTSGSPLNLTLNSTIIKGKLTLRATNVSVCALAARPIQA